MARDSNFFLGGISPFAQSVRDPTGEEHIIRKSGAVQETGSHAGRFESSRGSSIHYSSHFD